MSLLPLIEMSGCAGRPPQASAHPTSLFPADALPKSPYFGLPMHYYSVVLADPAWDFENYSQAGEAKGPKAQYDCMKLEAICQMPVQEIAAPDAALFLWATMPMLPEAIDVLRAWGFTYKSAFPWVKLSSTGNRLHWGTGYVIRNSAELVLIGTRGNPRIRGSGVLGLIAERVRGHSRKPDAIYTKIQALCPQGPYLEINARQVPPGWDAWGDEVGKFAYEGTALTADC